MSEENYRKAIVIILSVFVVSFIILGMRFVENGRYVQYDHQKDHVVFGNSMSNPQPSFIDSRSGKKQEME